MKYIVEIRSVRSGMLVGGTDGDPGCVKAEPVKGLVAHFLKRWPVHFPGEYVEEEHGDRRVRVQCVEEGTVFALEYNPAPVVVEEPTIVDPGVDPAYSAYLGGVEDPRD